MAWEDPRAAAGMEVDPQFALGRSKAQANLEGSRVATIVTAHSGVPWRVDSFVATNYQASRQRGGPLGSRFFSLRLQQKPEPEPGAAMR